MKRKCIAIMALILAVTLCACGTVSEQSGNGNQSIGQPITEPPIVSTSPTEATLITPENIFLNENNNFYDAGSVSIRPRYLYWDGDTLVAECFVINGLDKPVHNIVVDGLSFSNEQGPIADGAFGALEGAVIDPYTHIVWTFSFTSEAVSQVGGNLSTITYTSDTTYAF